MDQDRLHLANFPGLEEAFGISFEPDEISTLSIPLADIEKATSILNLHEAVDKVAKLYIDRVRKHLKNEEQDVDLWVLALPEIVDDDVGEIYFPHPASLYSVYYK